jgi:hypothetical protein
MAVTEAALTVTKATLAVTKATLAVTRAAPCQRCALPHGVRTRFTARRTIETQ